MLQSSNDTFPKRRASQYGMDEKRAVSALLKPFMLRFDSWQREAAYLSAMALARRRESDEQQRLRSRSEELAVEIEASFRVYVQETTAFSHTSKVRDLSKSYEQLLSSLRTLGAGEGQQPQYKLAWTAK